MDCETCREALSARLDGEPDGETDDGAGPAGTDRVDEHLRECAGCRSWQDRAAMLNRTLRVREVEPIPDLTDRIIDAAPVQGRPGRWWRIALAVIAAAQLWLGVSQVLGLDTGMTTSLTAPMSMPGDMSTHLFDESTAWNIAVGIGLAWVAWRVRAAAGMLVVLGGFVLVLAAFCVHDLAAGEVTVARVASHGLLPIGLALVWMVHRRCARPGDPVPGTPATAGADEWPVPAHTEVAEGPAAPRVGRLRRHLGPVGRRRAA